MQRTIALLPRKPGPYEEHRDYVLKVLARRCGWLDPSDREAIMHDAYALFLEKQRDGKLDVEAMRPPQVRAYLTQTALNKAMDEGKRAGRRSLSLDDEQLGLDPPDAERDIGEGLASRFDDARVREIVAELPERQQTVIKLRFFFGRSPQEIQRYLGVTERVYRRDLERATRRIAERFELVRDGGFCESRRSLILAYVVGIAGPTRAAEARRHLDTCPACANLAVEMRAVARRVAAVLPPPLTSLPVAGGLLGRAGAGVRGALHRAGDLAAPVRSQATKALVHADSSKAAALLAARPGAAAMLVAGCLAAGSTATYCVVHGVPAPIRSLVGDVASPRHHGSAARPVNKSQGSRAAGPAVGNLTVAPGARSADALPAVGPAATITGSHRQTSRTRPRFSSSGDSTRSGQGHTQSSKQAASAQFGFERGTATASSPSSSTPTPPTQSSSEAGSEFGFERRGLAASSPSSSTKHRSSVTQSRPTRSGALAQFGP